MLKTLYSQFFVWHCIELLNYTIIDKTKGSKTVIDIPLPAKATRWRKFNNFSFPWINISTIQPVKKSKSPKSSDIVYKTPK